MTIKQRTTKSKPFRTLTGIALVAALAGCVSSHVLVGNPRPPINPDQVRVYLEPPAQSQQIALLQSSSRAAFALSAQSKTDKVMQRLKKEAASLGANGIVLQGLGDQGSGVVGVDSTYISGSGKNASAFGISSGGGIYSKSGTAIAIYVPTEVSSR